MSPAELETVKPLIDGMIADTKEGKMKWARTSPTTFAWSKIVGGQTEGQLGLQKTQQRKSVLRPGPPPRQVIEVIDNFVLHAIEPNGNIRMTINTQQDPEARELLQTLFAAISTNADREAISFLKKILEPGV
jgi:hypothetical protein